jgi:DNA-binding NtrC family response regulator
MSTRSVLLVEDEPLIRMVLADALIDEGYHVSIASNVLEAIGVIGRNPTFDVLITDVDMPGRLTGLDLAAMVSSHALGTEIIITSGRTISKGLKEGWTFIAKPFGVRDFLQTLDQRLIGHFHFDKDSEGLIARAS